MRILKSQYVIYEDQINAISLKGQVECKDIPQENTFLIITMLHLHECMLQNMCKSALGLVETI